MTRGTNLAGGKLIGGAPMITKCMNVIQGTDGCDRLINFAFPSHRAVRFLNSRIDSDIFDVEITDMADIS